ncbi:MAG: tyrosine-protein phosphatase [Ilumatobacteraceae bacterium]
MNHVEADPAAPLSAATTDATDATADTDAADAAAADRRRLVRLDGVHNFRDLGGYPAAGGITRWNLVYRADGLQRLTAADLDILRARGLGVVIDLRTDTELSERGTFPTDQHSVSFHHVPVVDRTWMPGEVPEFDNAHDFLMWAYRDMLQVGADKLASGLEIIAAVEVLPLVFHCAAGKDRTGLLAALLLAVLGVPDACIAADYAKTGEAMVRMRAAWKAWAAERGAEEVAQLNEDRAHYFESPASVMQDLLGELAATHGSVVDFVLGLGVTTASVEALRARLIEPSV